jgi:hypothetical protein
MAKSRAGLPEGFQINLDSPSDLGDYLDEGFEQEAVRAQLARQRPVVSPVQRPVERAPEPPPRVVAPGPRPVTPQRAPQPTMQPRPQLISNDPLPAAERNEHVLNLAEARRRVAPRSQVHRRPERIQFNMQPETQKMFGELVEFVQRYSLQEDAKASEILDALVSMLHQSRDELSLHDVPRRGKWGTPTARAFPTALGNAFARAIAASFAKAGRGEV